MITMSIRKYTCLFIICLIYLSDRSIGQTYNYYKIENAKDIYDLTYRSQIKYKLQEQIIPIDESLRILMTDSIAQKIFLCDTIYFLEIHEYGYVKKELFVLFTSTCDISFQITPLIISLEEFDDKENYIVYNLIKRNKEYDLIKGIQETYIDGAKVRRVYYLLTLHRIRNNDFVCFKRIFMFNNDYYTFR